MPVTRWSDVRERFSPSTQSTYRVTDTRRLTPRGVLQRQAEDLDRLIARHEKRQVGRQFVARVLIGRVALAVTHHVSPAAAGRQWRRRPEGAAPLVTDEHRLTGRIRYRIVSPRRQTVVMAVAGPRVARALIRCRRTRNARRRRRWSTAREADPARLRRSTTTYS